MKTMIFMVLCVTPLIGGGDDDRKAVEAAVLDYVEAVYNMEPERIERSVHPDLQKIGFSYWKGKWGQLEMSYPKLLELARTWNKDGHIRADAPKEITVFEVKSHTASAKLVASWGQDYFHLAKIDEKWMIMNIMWQSLPE